jgi:hypothetical protein
MQAPVVEFKTLLQLICREGIVVMIEPAMMASKVKFSTLLFFNFSVEN